MLAVIILPAFPARRLAAVSGYASITLPAGDILGLPIGISFIGAEFSDAKLIQLAYALEHAGFIRKPPLPDL
jgi:amidase